MLRREYEAIIKRHLGFIDKLLAEKDELAKKCNELGENVKTMEKGFKDKVRMNAYNPSVPVKRGTIRQRY